MFLFCEHQRGNRLITKINYDVDVQIVNVREAMTHAEYDKDKWKGDCE